MQQQQAHSIGASEQKDSAGDTIISANHQLHKQAAVAAKKR
jgi:hypothetical protein